LYICSQEENDASQQYNSTEPIQWLEVYG
jgi:hypothetical protein